jgi:hypothetical protein
MSENRLENKQENESQIEVKKKIILYLHNDGFDGKALEPLILVDGEKLYIVTIKRKYPYDMYYFFENKKYLKAWNDSKGNVLIYINNWAGDIFIPNEQSTEYIDGFSYTVGEKELICENRNGQKKTIKIEGFDILKLAINEFREHEDAILYILCYKLS